jgi:hypothetical protein
MRLERVPQNHVAAPIRETRDILIVVHDKYFGIHDGYDTLDLVETQPFIKLLVNKDIGYYLECVTTINVTTCSSIRQPRDFQFSSFPIRLTRNENCGALIY